MEVLDARSRKLLFWAEPDIAAELISEGKVKPFGTKNVIRSLIWIGPPLDVIEVKTAVERKAYKASRHRPTHYSHDHETEENPANVWTLIMLPNHTMPVFLAVATGCLERFFDPALHAKTFIELGRDAA